MSALYAWVTSDTRKKAATAGGNRYMHLTIAYERGHEDWRTLTGNEIKLVVHFPEGASVPFLKVYLPEEIKCKVRHEHDIDFA